LAPIVSEARRGDEPMKARAILVGSYEEAVRALLSDALEELDVDVRVEARLARFDLVICVITRANLRRVLAEARRLSPDAPILAVMSLWNDDCEELVLQHGADACWALEWPIARLTQLVAAMLVRGRRAAPN
jgi:CheY-like chemotaxis protein